MVVGRVGRDVVVEDGVGRGGMDWGAAFSAAAVDAAAGGGRGVGRAGLADGVPPRTGLGVGRAERGVLGAGAAAPWLALAGGA